MQCKILNPEHLISFFITFYTPDELLSKKQTNKHKTTLQVVSINGMCLEMSLFALLATVRPDKGNPSHVCVLNMKLH